MAADWTRAKRGRGGGGGGGSPSPAIAKSLCVHMRRGDRDATRRRVDMPACHVLGWASASSPFALSWAVLVDRATTLCGCDTSLLLVACLLACLLACCLLACLPHRVPGRVGRSRDAPVGPCATTPSNHTLIHRWHDCRLGPTQLVSRARAGCDMAAWVQVRDAMDFAVTIARVSAILGTSPHVFLESDSRDAVREVVRAMGGAAADAEGGDAGKGKGKGKGKSKAAAEVEDAMRGLGQLRVVIL